MLTGYEEHLDHVMNEYNPYEDGGRELMLNDLRHFPVPGQNLQQWFLTDWDVWVENPGYHGPKCPPPGQEDCWSDSQWYEYNREYNRWAEKEAEWQALFEFAEERGLI